MLLQFRKLFPPTKWAEEFNAALTVPFFHWLVGPSEVTMLPTSLNNSLTCIAQAQRASSDKVNNEHEDYHVKLIFIPKL